MKLTQTIQETQISKLAHRQMKEHTRTTKVAHTETAKEGHKENQRSTHRLPKKLTQTINEAHRDR